jgi:hypothetical protein
LTLVGVAALIPSVSIARITEFVNRLTDQPVTDPRPFAGSLGLRRSPEAPTPIDQARVPGLPQQQLLGSGPELSDELVMVIQVEEPADEVIDSPRYYWRSLTYDRYTGRGWWTGTPRRIEQVANEALAAPSYTARRALIQTIDVITGTNQLVYTAGTLMNINQSYVAAWRSRSDLAGIEPDDAETDLFGATIEADPYQAASQISIATENELRQAGADYPDWIRRRYLALPDELPRQIIGLARDLTATQPNPYDRAKAIEAYLRAFPYSLDLPPPPANREMVDYFLFELTRGYCG